MPPVLAATRFAAFILFNQLAENPAPDVIGMGCQLVALGGPDDFDDEK